MNHGWLLTPLASPARQGDAMGAAVPSGGSAIGPASFASGLPAASGDSPVDDGAGLSSGFGPVDANGPGGEVDVSPFAAVLRKAVLSSQTLSAPTTTAATSAEVASPRRGVAPPANGAADSLLPVHFVPWPGATVESHADGTPNPEPASVPTSHNRPRTGTEATVPRAAAVTTDVDAAGSSEALGQPKSSPPAVVVPPGEEVFARGALVVRPDSREVPTTGFAGGEVEADGERVADAADGGGDGSSQASSEPSPAKAETGPRESPAETPSAAERETGNTLSSSNPTQGVGDASTRSPSRSDRGQSDAKQSSGQTAGTTSKDASAVRSERVEQTGPVDLTRSRAGIGPASLFQNPTPPAGVTLPPASSDAAPADPGESQSAAADASLQTGSVVAVSEATTVATDAAAAADGTAEHASQRKNVASEGTEQSLHSQAPTATIEPVPTASQDASSDAASQPAADGSLSTVATEPAGAGAQPHPPTSKSEGASSASRSHATGERSIVRRERHVDGEAQQTSGIERAPAASQFDPEAVDERPSPNVSQGVSPAVVGPIQPPSVAQLSSPATAPAVRSPATPTSEPVVSRQPTPTFDTPPAPSASGETTLPADEAAGGPVTTSDGMKSEPSQIGVDGSRIGTVKPGAANSPTSAESTTPLPTMLQDQLTQGLERAVRQRPSALWMRLDPPELGALAIEVVERDGRIEVRLEPERASTGRLLLEHADSLRDLAVRTLGRSDVATTQVDVEIIDSNPNDPSGRSAEREFGRRDANDSGQPERFGQPGGEPGADGDAEGDPLDDLPDETGRQLQASRARGHLDLQV